MLVITLTNSCHIFDKSKQKIWQIHVTTLNNLGKFKLVLQNIHSFSEWVTMQDNDRNWVPAINPVFMMPSASGLIWWSVVDFLVCTTTMICKMFSVLLMSNHAACELWNKILWQWWNDFDKAKGGLFWNWKPGAMVQSDKSARPPLPLPTSWTNIALRVRAQRVPDTRPLSDVFFHTQHDPIHFDNHW